MAKQRVIPASKSFNGETIPVPPPYRKPTIHDLPAEILEHIIGYCIPDEVWFGPSRVTYAGRSCLTNNTNKPHGLYYMDPNLDTKRVDVRVFHIDSGLRQVALDTFHRNTHVVLRWDIFSVEIGPILQRLDLGFGDHMFAKLRHVTLQIALRGEEVQIDRRDVHRGFTISWYKSMRPRFCEMRSLLFGLFERSAYRSEIVATHAAKTKVDSEWLTLTTGDPNGIKAPRTLHLSHIYSDIRNPTRSRDLTAPSMGLNIANETRTLKLQIMLFSPRLFKTVLSDCDGSKVNYFRGLQISYVMEMFVKPFADQYGWEVEGNFNPRVEEKAGNVKSDESGESKCDEKGTEKRGVRGVVKTTEEEVKDEKYETREDSEADEEEQEKVDEDEDLYYELQDAYHYDYEPDYYAEDEGNWRSQEDAGETHHENDSGYKLPDEDLICLCDEDTCPLCGWT